MIKIPVNSRMLKALLCISLVFDMTLSICILSGANQGYCCGIQGTVMESRALSSDDHQGISADKPCPNIVLYVRDTSTNKIITTVTCDEEGFFKVHLVPGRYLLEVASTEDIFQLPDKSNLVDLEEGEFESIAVRVERKPAKYSQLPNLYFY